MTGDWSRILRILKQEAWSIIIDVSFSCFQQCIFNENQGVFVRREHPPCGCHDRRGGRGMSNGGIRPAPMRFRTSAASRCRRRGWGCAVAVEGGGKERLAATSSRRGGGLGQPALPGTESSRHGTRASRFQATSSFRPVETPTTSSGDGFRASGQ